MMKIYKCLLICLIAWIVKFDTAQAQVPDNALQQPGHPRMLFLKAQEGAVLADVGKDTSLRKIQHTIIKNCDAMLDKPPVADIKIGKRLLDKSRECLRRVFYLAYAYRTTHQKKYLDRAEKEMLAVGAFPDWNPTHFLDVAEMTTALAIGYDWLYNDLPASSRNIIKQAILKNGIEPSLNTKYNYWLKATNNWNQVCNTGMALGAIATYEDHPDLSLQIINRSIKAVALPMKQYEPDGGYPEGYGYWSYGTTYNVLLISALESAFGKDFGLTGKGSFMKTASFLQSMTAPSGRPFNFSDAGKGAEFNPALFWFANRLHNPSLLWVTKQQLATNISLSSRFLPAAMFWGNGIAVSNATAPVNTVWVGQGVTPVALMRTSWTDPNAIYVGFKGGSPSESHAHMDEGSFVMEADGIRWAMDLGMQNYESLESKGIDLWNMSQSSPRWKVLRYNNKMHNTLTLSNSLQNVKGKASIISRSADVRFMNAVADLSSLYAGKAAQVKRGIAIINKEAVAIQDEIKTGADTVTVRWSMVTPAHITMLNNTTAQLDKDGKKLTFNVAAPVAVKIKTWSTQPTTAYDEPNPDTQIIGFEAKLPANTLTTLKVYLIPGQVKKQSDFKLPALAQWPK